MLLVWPYFTTEADEVVEIKAPNRVLMSSPGLGVLPNVFGGGGLQTRRIGARCFLAEDVI